MALDPQFAVQMLEKRRAEEEQRRLAPAQSFATGALTGAQNAMTERAEAKKADRGLIEKVLTGGQYEITKNVTGSDGKITESPIDLRDVKLISSYYEQNGDLPPGSVYNFKPKSVSLFGNVSSGVRDIPEGMEVTGYDSKGQPIVRKIEMKHQTTRKQDPYQYAVNRLRVMGDDLDSDKQVNNPYGIAAKGYDRAMRLASLVSQYKDYNLDQRETEELAIGLNSILSGSNQSAQEQVKSLVPKSAIGSVQKLKEWLTNNPQGLQQQAFVKRMYNDVKREADTMYNQLMEKASKKIAKYNDILDNINDLPDEDRQSIIQQYNDIITSRGINLEDYKKWKAGGYKPRAIVPQSVDHGAETSGELKVGTMDGGYKYIGGDPANPASWEAVQ